MTDRSNSNQTARPKALPRILSLWETGMPPIKVKDIAYVRFSAPDLGAMERFLLDFGLLRAHRTDTALYMRGVGPSPYLHATELGEPGFLGAAFEAGSEDELIGFAQAEGVAVEALDGPGGGLKARMTDPDGFGVELVAGRTQTDEIATRKREPFNSALERSRFNTLKRVGHGPSQIRRIGHCVLNVSDFRRAEAWYKQRFGFITSDEIEAGPGVAVGAFMRCDRGSNPTDHHTLFVLGTGHPMFNHAAFEVLDFDDLMRGNTHLEKATRAHDWGVGRHFLGSQIFDYWLDPWGHGMEHWTDGDMLDAEWGSRRASMQELIGVQWGPSFPHPLTPMDGPPAEPATQGFDD
jgi:catechol 2,3-dioxygenase-like lactoylglutathione lyase family enzyme